MTDTTIADTLAGIAAATVDACMPRVRYDAATAAGRLLVVEPCLADPDGATYRGYRWVAVLDTGAAQLTATTVVPTAAGRLGITEGGVRRARVIAESTVSAANAYRVARDLLAVQASAGV